QGHSAVIGFNISMKFRETRKISVIIKEKRGVIHFVNIKLTI
ncbi:unnamed protein product, partial [marine sediment metagenome]